MTPHLILMLEKKARRSLVFFYGAGNSISYFCPQQSPIFIFQSRSEIMDNPFQRIMAAKSDATLKTIFQERHRYEPEAYIAAVEELERRQLITADEKEKAVQPLPDTQNVNKQQEPRQRTSWKEMLRLFKVTKEYIYTPIIIAINILVWLAMVLSGVNAVDPSVESLLNWGGNLAAITLNGELWRLLTSTFVHVGIFHLLLNMYALIQVGHILEIHFGKHRYALVYLVTGIFASLSSAAFNENVVSVGASGAIFGLYGLLVSLLITKSLKITPEERQALLTGTLTFVGYNVMFGFAKSGIDNAAHIGGLLSGFVIGFIYNPFIKEQKDSLIASVSLVAVMLIAIWFSPRLVNNPYVEFQTAVQTFSEKEEAAMWMYQVDFPEPGSEEARHFRERLKTEGVDLWKENLASLGKLENMPVALQERVDLLKKYCELRIQACEIMQSLMENDDEEQAGRLHDVNVEIEALIDSLEKLNK